ncbi:hypothetical protein CGUA_05295 [Corynebacterium guangdongense]|uniref:Polyisoprenoid-binding protein YceI n=2 Tax=Corynebacterium guangdongense TaxID=1783348 RepID=A0ABU1ZWD8_9CORY|nr:YceI family protein [Corynebacterium guangdongense]MDR7329075.1 polyisoprenoid-binding protein YceI [Corynebacterium guangdongense]WJZ17644.1 hypothetical protein CGUA_05295 [Corynebacterium guangdongense]
MAYNGTFELDPTHTTIGFVARHAMVTKVRGSFSDWSSEVNIDEANPANSVVNVTVKTASIDTNNADRDGHVRNEDFFNVEQYPDMTFKSTNVEFEGENAAKITGDLTIKDVTKPVVLDVEIFGSEVDPWGQTRVGFDAKTEINRKDWGLEWNSPLNSGGVLVSEKIKIEIEGSAIQR